MMSKTFRLFISSTFKDFIKERNILNNRVYKKVNDYCRNLGYEFQIIDLRWGVSTEAALNQRTIEICLDEVRRCGRVSPCPNFLVMIGERYGWIPLPYSIDSEEYIQIYEICNNDEKKILDEWYLYDENSVKGKYTLLARTGEFKDEFRWSEKEKELKNILIRNAKKCGFNENIMEKYNMSATEQEIVEGFLGDECQNENIISFFRNNYDSSKIKSNKITRLKKRIKLKMEEKGCVQNLIELDYEDAEYENMFCEYITESLIRNISKEITRLERIDDLNADIKEISNKKFEQSKRNLKIYTESYFFGREDEIEKLKSYIDSESDKVLYVWGESGVGKTSLLANFLSYLKGYFVYCFFGMNEESYTLLDVISYICRTLSERFVLPNVGCINIDNMTEKLQYTLSLIPEKESVVIVIDGLESFYDIEDIKENIFPKKLFGKTKMIVSSAEECNITKLAGETVSLMRLESLNKDNSIRAFNSLMKQYGRCLKNYQQRNIIKSTLEKGGSPLQIKLMSMVCKNWHSADVVSEFPESARKIAYIHIKDMYEKRGHDRELVVNALSLVAASPYGLTEEEMQYFLFKIPTVRSCFFAEDRYKEKLDKLPFVIWSRLFYDLNESITLVNRGNHIVIKFSHDIFLKVVTEEFGEYIDNARRIMVEYYESKNIYVNSKTRYPETRKIINLINLYKVMNERKKLYELMCDFDMVDAALKTMNIDRVIDIYRNLIDDVDGDNKKRRLEEILYCIVRNYEMLMCYKGEFYQCAYACGIYTSNAPILEWHENEMLHGNKHFFLPYSKGLTEIAWSPEATKYAVCSISKVWIYNREDNREFAKIYIGGNKDEKALVQKVIWIDEKTLLVWACEKNIGIYEIVEQTVCKKGIIDIIPDDNKILYSYKKNVLIFQQKGIIYVYNPVTGKKLYSIKGKKQTVQKYDLSPDECTISVVAGRSIVKIYDIESGQYLMSHKFKFKNIFAGWEDMELHHIDEKTYVKINDLSSEIMLFDTVTGKIKYLTIPSLPLVKDLKILDKYIFCIYDNVLVCIDCSREYSMYCLPGNIQDVSYIKKQNMIAVLSDDTMHLIGIDKLKALEYKLCIVSKNPLSPLRNMLNTFDRMFDVINYCILLRGKPLSYQALRFYARHVDDVFKITHDRTNIHKATILKKAADGKIAVAYETANVIKIFDKRKNEQLCFYNMDLSIDNSILDVEFSSDSKKIYIWRNYSIKVVNLEKGKCILDLNLVDRNAEDVCFLTENKLNVVIKKKNYTFDITDKNKRVNKKLPPKSGEDILGPYLRGGIPIMTNVERLFCEGVLPSEWFTDVRAYYGKNKVLFFNCGHYSVDGSEKMADYCYDFSLCLHKNRTEDADEITSFLREKNDVMSKLIEINQQYVVLVAYAINSVVVFDCIETRVVAAYRYQGQIVGFEYSERKRKIILYSNEDPDGFEIKINLL